MPLPRPMLAFALLLGAAVAGGQETRRSEFPAESTQLLNRLKAVDKLNRAAKSPEAWAAALGQLAGPGVALAAATPVLLDHNSVETWDKLLDEYTQLLQDADDALVPLPAQSPLWTRAATSMSLARLCQLRLVDLPSVVLSPYRQRIDPEAKKQLETGRERRVAEPLRRLVEERYCSSFTGQALDLLGDLAFEKGRFDEADHWWRQLAPLPSEARQAAFAESRRVPSPQPLQAAAKRILALAFLGDLPRAQHELDLFHAAHPDAAGHLAGREGRYAQTLRDVIVDLAKAGPFTNQDDSPTFAGDASRNRTLMQCPPSRLWEDGPAWRVKLPDTKPMSRKPAYHPVIVKDLVLLADVSGLTGYDLFTGKERFRTTQKPREKAALASGFSMTVEGSRAYLRLGAAEIGPRVGEAAHDETSELVCVDFSDERKPRVAWKSAPLASVEPTFFEGAPLVVEGQVYVAQSRVVARRTHTFLVNYDRNGRVRWKREVSDCPEFEERESPRSQHHLLTWAGGQLVYTSHAGSVVAVEPWTGQPLWALRYPTRKQTAADADASREAAPALAWGGRIFVAPHDSDHLLCLDAATGRVVWDHDGADVVHLLGVSGDRLIVATKRGLAAHATATGQSLWTQPSDGRLPSLGRGLVAGGWVFWPTQDRKLPLRAVTLADGQQQKAARGQGFFAEPDFFDATQLSPIPAGNMAFGQGCLAVAGSDELIVFVPADKIPPPPPGKETALEQHYREMRVALAAGRRADAAAVAARLLDATKDTPRAVVWRELLEARLTPLAERVGVPHPSVAATPKPRENRAEIAPPVLEGKLPYALAWRRAADTWLPCQRIEAAPEDERVFTFDAGSLVCRDLADGVICWRAPLPFTPTWLGQLAHRVLVGGPDAVRALDLLDGATLWHFPAPSRFHPAFAFDKHLPQRITPCDGFVGFRLGERTLTVCDDQRRFLVFDIATGEIVADQRAEASAIRPLDAGFFLPRWQVVGSSILAQSHDGKVRWLDAQEPRIEAATAAWSNDPLVLGGLIFIPSARGQLQAVEVGSRKVRWTFTASWPSTLTGEALEAFGAGDKLLVRVPRSLGHELLRLDPASGKALWTLPAGQLRGGLTTKFLDGEKLYHVVGKSLVARSLIDGEVVWTRELPRASDWKLLALPSALVLSPASADGKTDCVTLLLDPATGQLAEQIRLDGSRTTSVGVQRQRLLVFAGGALACFAPQPANNP